MPFVRPHHAGPHPPGPFGPPLALLREDGRKGSTGRPGHDARTEPDDRGPGRVLVCAVCRRRITSESARMTKAGRHLHVFANPLGLVFEVGCFNVAAGCLRTGPPSLDFTWFPGYAWQPAVCSGCGGHMGWFYQDASGDAFWGLLVERLEPEDDH